MCDKLETNNSQFHISLNIYIAVYASNTITEQQANYNAGFHSLAYLQLEFECVSELEKKHWPYIHSSKLKYQVEKLFYFVVTFYKKNIRYSNENKKNENDNKKK